MDRFRLITVLAMTVFGEAASEDIYGTHLACSLGPDDAKTAQCSQYGTVIRVRDVFDLTCPGNDPACSPDCGDTGTPVIELNPDRYSDIVFNCESRQSCEPFRDTEGRVEAVRYKCVKYAQISTQTIRPDENLSDLFCPMNETTLFVSLAYAVYPTKSCSPAIKARYHLESTDFRFVKDSCDGKNICDFVKLTIHQTQLCSTNGRNESVISIGVVIYHSCNPQTDEPATQPITTSPSTKLSVLTSFSGRSTDQTTYVTSFNAGIHIGLYAGVPAVVLVVAIVIAVSIICVKRKKNSQIAMNISGNPAGLDMEPSSAAPGNIYSLGEHYSEVVPMFPKQMGAGLTSSQPSGHPAVLTSPTERLVLNNTQSDVRGQDSVGDEYAMVQKGGHDPDELVMQDNSTYEATPMVGSRTPGVGATEDTDLVDNTQYTPWENPRLESR